MSRHASPFHCPYCGEENLFPHEGTSGADVTTGRAAEGAPHQDGWECRACLRAFHVTFLGQLPRPTVTS